MSLLQTLNLSVPKHLLPAGGGPLPAPPVSGATATPPAPTKAVAKAVDKSAGGDASDPRSEAGKVRGAIEARRKQTAELLLRMQKVEPVLKEKLDAASGDEKKKLAEQEGVLAKKIADAERVITQAEADLKAIDNPGAKREELLAILARQRLAGKVDEAIEISSPGLDPYKKGKVNRDVTTTTTSYADGKATTDKQREQQKVGLDGYTKTQSRDKEVTDGKTTARTGEAKKTNVSLGGKVSVEEKKSAEVELKDGRKAGVESTKAKEISAKGVSQSTTVKKTNFDGSSNSTTAKKGVERGDGKVTATKSSSVTTTNTSGTAKTTDKGVSGGVVSGKDGTGVQGSVTGGKTVTSKKGMQAGVVAGLHANVLCRVGEPSGEPKLYPVTVTVSFGGSVAVSGGAGKKEGSKGSASVEVKGSAERSMVVTHHLNEAELADYTKALAAASTGSKVAATQQELAVIATGVKQGWDVARQMWESGGKEISKKTTDTLKRTGDSAQVSQTDTRGVAVKGSVGPVGGGYGVTDTKSKSTKATRNDKGGLDVDTKQEHGREKTVSGSLQAGVVGLEIGTTHVHKTRFGYSISIEPKNDPDGKILAALNQCKTEIQYEMFIAAHFGKVTLIGRTKGKSDSESTQIGVTVAGATLKLGTHQGIDEDVTTDGTGKVVSKKTEGHAGAGGELVVFADSTNEDAVAESDGQGNAKLTLTRTTKQNYGSRVREKKAQKKLEKASGKGSGALTDAAGGQEDDSATQDVSGLVLSNKELRRIGGMAVRSMPAWMGRTRRWQEKEDWKAAGLAIARANAAPSVVAHELARFIGGDRVERMKTVELFVRGGSIAMGKAFEFPDSLRDLQTEYDMVIDDSIPAKMDKLAASSPVKAVEECKRLGAIVDKIDQRIRSAKDFDNKAVKMEMLQRLTRRRESLDQGIKGYAGNNKPQDDPKVLEAKRDRLIKQCSSFYEAQAHIKSELAELLEGDTQFLARRKGDARAQLRRMYDLHERWWVDFRELKDTMAKLGVPNYDLPTLKPDLVRLAFYEKAAGV